MKTNTAILTIVAAATTSSQLKLSLLPTRNQQELSLAGCAATFLGITADQDYGLFEISDCHSLAHVQHRIDLSYQPQENSFLYSLKCKQKECHDLLTHLDQIAGNSEVASPQNSISPQLVLEQSTTPAKIRILSTSSRVSLIEVPERFVALFTDSLSTQFNLIRHPISHQSILSTKSNQQDSLKERLKRLHYIPEIDQILPLLSTEKLLTDIKILSESVEGEWKTRHTFSEGALNAVKWLKNQYRKLGAHCELDYYLPDLAPNLICKLQWLVDQDLVDDLDNIQSIVLTAHYDSKGSFGHIDAPGVDDNASGCSILLSIASILQEETSQNFLLKSSKLKPINNKDKLPELNGRRKMMEVKFIHFSGNQQGLLGSRSVSQQLSRSNILLLMNVDMISYRVKGEPLQLGLSSQGASPESVDFIHRISNVYVPELLVGNATIGQSDEFSFINNGFVNSIRFFERIGSVIKNPYHLKSSDQFSNFLDLDEENPDSPSVDGGYDIFQTVLIGKVILASVLELLFF
ncbi:hypothetical protein PSTG_01927 [Puccinia striiformis f. sp. tritici PST-78]|uniref:Peptide hydrolase n=1 Tax=Puccinia striiformis f. sp. tritici PST-78 TaxID=1165861 RepID=A0A0L0W031_9BASI|nr:hypothetical protein PSTG_01927 [Puccinia striiformis f. sp. tritici PST-78]